MLTDVSTAGCIAQQWKKINIPDTLFESVVCSTILKVDRKVVSTKASVKHTSEKWCHTFVNKSPIRQDEFFDFILLLKWGLLAPSTSLNNRNRSRNDASSLPWPALPILAGSGSAW